MKQTHGSDETKPYDGDQDKNKQNNERSGPLAAVQEDDSAAVEKIVGLNCRRQLLCNCLPTLDCDRRILCCFNYPRIAGLCPGL